MDLGSSLVILLVIVMILTDMFGLMYWWSIQLNAVSLVNLVMAVGIRDGWTILICDVRNGGGSPPNILYDNGESKIFRQ